MKFTPRNAEKNPGEIEIVSHSPNGDFFMIRKEGSETNFLISKDELQYEIESVELICEHEKVFDDRPPFVGGNDFAWSCSKCSKQGEEPINI